MDIQDHQLLRLWSFCLPQISGTRDQKAKKLEFLKFLIIDCVQEILVDLQDAEPLAKFEQRYADP